MPHFGNPAYSKLPFATLCFPITLIAHLLRAHYRWPWVVCNAGRRGRKRSDNQSFLSLDFELLLAEPTISGNLAKAVLAAVQIDFMIEEGDFKG
jgi:hypothetical protein